MNRRLRAQLWLVDVLESACLPDDVTLLALKDLLQTPFLSPDQTARIAYSICATSVLRALCQDTPGGDILRRLESEFGKCSPTQTANSG